MLSAAKWLPGALLPETGRFCRRILPENDTTARETCRINLPERKIPHREQRKPESGLFDTMESDGVRMTFRFAEQEPETDVKENIVNILTSQFIRRTVSAP